MAGHKRRSRNGELTPAALDQMLDTEIRTRMHFIHRLEESPVEKVLRTGEVLGPLRFADQEARCQYLETNGFYSRFRKGDLVQVRVRNGDGSTEQLFDTSVREVTYPREGRLRISVGKSRNNQLDGRTDYFVYPAENEFLMSRLAGCVAERADALGKQRKSPRLDPTRAASPFLDQLNPSQSDAFDFLTSHDSDGAVQGPPGTGKTQLLLALVSQALACKLKVGIAAFTHAAVDNALSRISELDRKGSFCRVGRPEMINADVYPKDWLRGRKAKSFSEADERDSLFAATTHSWALSPSAPEVDLMIVDEAGQVPVYFTPILLSLGRKIVCLGDHKQLPPVLQGNHSNTVEHTEVFSHFLESGSPMLEVQYRMNSQIQSWPSTQFYEGRLRADASNADRDVLSGFNGPKGVLGSRPLQLITHKKSGDSNANTGEASMVAEMVDRLFKASDLLPASQIGIISPRRMQNGAINQALQQKFGVELASQIQVDTVERYQGQEREVILFSFGNDQGLPLRDDMSFIGDAQRLNVAVTRARSRLYCFASEKLANLRNGKEKRSLLPSFFGSFVHKKSN